MVVGRCALRTTKQRTWRGSKRLRRQYQVNDAWASPASSAWIMQQAAVWTWLAATSVGMAFFLCNGRHQWFRAVRRGATSPLTRLVASSTSDVTNVIHLASAGQFQGTLSHILFLVQKNWFLTRPMQQLSETQRHSKYRITNLEFQAALHRKNLKTYSKNWLLFDSSLRYVIVTYWHFYTLGGGSKWGKDKWMSPSPKECNVILQKLTDFVGQ